MHYSTLFTLLTAFTSLTTALPRPHPILQPPPKALPIKFDSTTLTPRTTIPNGYITKRALDSGAKILKPIRLHPRRSHDKRDVVDFSKLDPAKQAQLVYGAPDSDGSLFLANMTLHAPDGNPIVMMESFESLTSAIDCDGTDGVMSLTFTSQEALEYAHGKWAYINEDKDQTFIMIANHEGCGPEEQRIPYIITDVDRKGLKVILKSKQETWDKISGSFEIDFGKIGLAASDQHLVRRQFLDKLKEKTKKGLESIKEVADKAGEGIKKTADKVGDGVKEGAEKVGTGVKKGATAVKEGVDKGLDAIGKKMKDAGDGEFEKAIVLPMGTGGGMTGLNVFTDPTGTLSIDCVDCNLSGSLKITGHVAVDNFKPTILTFTAQPVDLKASIQLGVTLSAVATDFVSPLSFSKNLVAIPLGGIVIPQVFSLGPKLDFELGASLSIDGDAYFTFGIQATLPNTAKIHADVLNPKLSSATGFNGAKATIIPFTVETFTSTIDVSAFALPLVAIGFEVLGGAFGAETSLKFKVPSITASMVADFDPLGACDTKKGASKTGVTITSKAILEGLFFVGTDKTVGETAVVNKSLFNKTWDLPSTCIPIDIPGLEGAIGDEEEEEVVEEEEEEVVEEEEEEEVVEEEVVEEEEEVVEEEEEEVVEEEEEVEETVPKTTTKPKTGTTKKVAAEEEEEEVEVVAPKKGAATTKKPVTTTKKPAAEEEEEEIVEEEEVEEEVVEEEVEEEVVPAKKAATTKKPATTNKKVAAAEEEEEVVEEEVEEGVVPAKKAATTKKPATTTKKVAAVEEEEEIVEEEVEEEEVVEEEVEEEVVPAKKATTTKTAAKKVAAVEDEEEVTAGKKKTTAKAAAVEEEEEEVVEEEEEVVEEEAVVEEEEEEVVAPKKTAAKATTKKKAE